SEGAAAGLAERAERNHPVTLEAASGDDYDPPRRSLLLCPGSAGCVRRPGARLLDRSFELPPGARPARAGPATGGAEIQGRSGAPRSVAVAALLGVFRDEGRSGRRRNP